MSKYKSLKGLVVIGFWDIQFVFFIQVIDLMPGREYIFIVSQFLFPEF